jgi:PAS domain-containing protein
MRELENVDAYSSSLARSALLTAAILALAGSALGVSAIVKGYVSGEETILVLAGGLFGLGLLVTPFAYRKSAAQTVAAVSIVFYTVYLCCGVLVSLLSRGSHDNLSVYLLWFFALLMLNKMVNSRAAGNLMDKVILIAPLVIVCGSFPRILRLFSTDGVYQAVSFCLSYICFGLMLNSVTRYREAYIVERERTESLRTESEVLESISDCFISLDSEFRLVYLNDAACSEFAIDRRAALKNTIPGAVPGFFSESMLAQLRAASDQASAAEFEALDMKGQWYEMRCFPQPGRMSVFFRNITESVLSRRQLEAAHNRMREQSELLDQAQDAIFVQNMEHPLLEPGSRASVWLDLRGGDRTAGRRVFSISHFRRSNRHCIGHATWRVVGRVRKE